MHRTDAPAARDRAALAAALDPIITIDIRGTVLSASDSVHRVLGWTSEEIIGRNVSILMPEPHHSAHNGYLANYHRTGQTNIMNRPRRFEALRKDGSLIPIELCVSQATMPQGASPLFVGIIRDMSAFAAAERSRDEERVQAQNQLAVQTAALQQANLRLRMADRMASIGTLAAGLGHDMNNVLLPVRARLNALRAASELIKLPAAHRKHIDEIRKSVAYLQQLADGLHFLALDPEIGEDTLSGGASTNLRTWWSQTGALLSKAVPKHVRVSASIPADLPKAAVAAHGLTQAILNLVVNAGEAIPGPNKRKRHQGLVSVRAAPMHDSAGSWVRLSVTDNGSGMSEDVKRRAFEMFFTTKPRGMGTGLGLALVRKVVERARGRVDIESEVGKGTTVAMFLPIAGSCEPEREGASTPIAVISIADGRAANIIRHVLEVSGARLGSDPKLASIWIVDPASTPLKTAKRWRSIKPKGQLVLFGKPSSQATAQWQALEPVIIEQTDDFEAVRMAFGRALSA